MHELISDTLGLLNRTLGKGVTILATLDAERSIMVGDPSQLQQAVMNLCINARDAMPEGGTIRLETSMVQLSDSECENNPFHLEPGPYIRLMIADSGSGIPSEVQDRIFEPFFTTKEKGQGTGLGLAAVYGCIKDHRGAISVESHSSLGTRFTLDLPLQDVELSIPLIPEEKAVPRRQGCILVVDDDETVRGMAEEMLSSVGYSVLTACDGAEGLLLFSEYVHKIDVVLLDLVMPRLSGRHAFHGLRRVDPDASVVLTSGFAQQHTIEDLLKEGLTSFISKPYRRAELVETIEKARLIRMDKREMN